jgi:hypothetical protein
VWQCSPDLTEFESGSQGSSGIDIAMDGGVRMAWESRRAESIYNQQQKAQLCISSLYPPQWPSKSVSMGECSTLCLCSNSPPPSVVSVCATSDSFHPFLNFIAGRIGRIVLRNALENKEIEVVAVNECVHFASDGSVVVECVQ